MISQEIRKKFLSYFQRNGHTVVPSSPVFPHDDPTLLFVNAGMNQFKDVFLGRSKRDYSRATSSQKCVRVGGKHNDLENVGHTSRHLTFFEMLGNFSFGDYFKADAIRFAWEVSTSVFGFDPKRIWVSVFREDDEAFDIWVNYLPAERIVRLDERDNFWAMGETGPCGPCSELLFDRGDLFGPARSPYEDTEGERYLEFWNLVFMQYNRSEGGVMNPLPAKAIDTGAGLERVVSLVLGKDSLFETDILGALIERAGELFGVSVNRHAQAPLRVIADHLRSLSFAIADGLQPSNVDRGYVLRKVLRRAVRYGRQLGAEQPFLAKLLPSLVELMGADFPELATSQKRIEEIVSTEEEAFFRTLRRGGNLLNRVVERSKESGDLLSGDDAFLLKDTYGLPLEEVLLIAKDTDLRVDLERYQALEQEARDRSKQRHKVVRQEASENAFKEILERVGATSFVGYTQATSKARVVALLKDGAEVERLLTQEEGIVLLDRTPFYAEKGGQVGDKGVLTVGKSRFLVLDCQSPFAGLVAHIGQVESGELSVGDEVVALIEEERRHRIACNHTATHLLHFALQQILGSHVRQTGSVVESERLRFDFSHHKALTREEIRQIEDDVNAKIRANTPVQTYEAPFAEVQKRGDIKQFFGDKYGAVVRVVDIDASKELCGGTHTAQTGNIGYFRISRESSIAAGMRRIEAVTGEQAALLDRATQDVLEDASRLLETQPIKLLERIQKVVEENTQYAQEVREAKRHQLAQVVALLMTEAEVGEKGTFVVARVNTGIDSLREIADPLIDRLKKGVVVLAASDEEKCALLARSTTSAVNCGELIRELAPIIGGKGGGRPELAQAGGKETERLEEALAQARERVRASIR